MTASETLYPFHDFSAELPIRITLAGITHPDPAYKVFRPLSKLNVLEYIVSGKGFLELENRRHPVKAGQIYLLRQGVSHSYGADPKDPYEKIFFNISGPLCDDLFHSFHLKAGVFEDPGVREAFFKIPEIMASGKSPAEIQTQLLGILMQILSTLAIAKSQEKLSHEAIKLKQHLDQNQNRAVSAKELAGVIFRSPDYCRKLFLRSFGLTPYAYQLEQKIRRAKIFLTETSLSVGEISALLGYDDPHYFSNLFLTKTGKRPLHWRKTKNAE